MAYPSIPITTASTPTRIDGYIPVRATNGALKMRKMHDADKMEFALVHELTFAQRLELENHYQANKALSFSFTWPATGVAYTVVYMSAPLYFDQPGGWSKAQVRLGEV